MIDHKHLRLTKIALALSIALAGAPAFAQNTTSAIGGRISSADGKPASGATVLITHTESGSVSSVVTDAEGRYVARGLRVGGPYTITITQGGVSEKREGIFTQLAETASLDATLGAAMQTVTIAGNSARAQTFNRTNMGTVTNIGSTQIESLASIQRNLQDLARIDPRISQTDKERGEISAAGQNSRYNSTTIDGVSVSDTFGLESNGSPTAKQPISIEAIQSVQVNVANYDVTQKDYTGANINAVTKSGTNAFKGSVYYVYRDDRVVGDRYNATNDTYSDAPKFDESTRGFTLGGPLIKDKLFFFASVEESTSSRNAPAFGPIGSPLTNVGISNSAIASAQTIAKNTYGIDIGSTAVPGNVEFKSNEALLRVDWNINDDQRAMFRYQKTDQSEPIFPGFSQTGLSLSSEWYTQGKSIETLVGQWFADWTPTFSTEVKASSRDYKSVPVNNARLPLIGLRFAGALPADAPAGLSTAARTLNFGTDNSRQANELATKTADFYAGANWSRGDHEIKFGVDYSENKIYNLFLQNVFGNYTYACINSTASFTYDIGAVNCTTGSNATLEAAVLENFRRNRPMSYLVQLALPGFKLQDGVAAFTLKNSAVFAQDTWNVSKNLTLTYGVRVDRSGVNTTPARNLAAAAPVIPGNPVTGARQTGGFGYDNTVTTDGNTIIQPRVGFNYKFDAANAMQLRGGAGLFQGAGAPVWLANPFSNPGVVTTSSGCGTLNFSACSSAFVGSINPDAQPIVPSTPPAANVDFLSPSLRQPSIIKMNLAFESELPWMGLVFGAEYLYTKNKDAITYQHLNLGAATRVGIDGRELYWTPQGYNSACFTATGTTLFTGVCAGLRNRALSNASYGNVTLVTKTDKGDANVLTLELKSPLRKGLGWALAYTRTEATEVSALTSSTANSNFNGRAVLNPNEDVASNSSYLVKDRVGINMTWQKQLLAGYKTSFGMFYEGRSGKPYSWTVNNDLNGDNLAGNDLMYIPKAPGSGDVSFFGDTATSHANEDKFWAIVNANPELKGAAGGVVRRNSTFAPWTNSLDLRVSQEIPGFTKSQKGTFTLDFLNFGNLLNKKWGRINEVGFQANGAQARSFVDYQGLDAKGHYIYRVRDLETIDIRQNRGESQWAIQATARYSF